MEEVLKNIPKEPRWVWPVSILSGFFLYMVFGGLLTGDIPSPLGIKGEGLLFSLILYLPIRVILRSFYLQRMKPCR